jgi:hypothetical protein
MIHKTKSRAAMAFVVVLLIISQSAQSQILISLLLGDKLNSPNLEFGLEGGYNHSTLSGIDEAKGYGHFHLGFYFDIRVKNDWWLNTGVRVKSDVGATKSNPYSLNDPDLDTVFSDGFVKREIGYFYVPVHIKYRFVRDFFVMAGFQAGLRNSATDYFTNTYFDKDDVTLSFDIRDNIKRLDFGLSGGGGYKFKGSGLNLGFAYYYGLVDIDKSPDVNSKNSTFYIYVDIPIGAGYKEKKSAESAQ